jgi:hypothetical protein
MATRQHQTETQTGALHECINCRSALVYPIQWEPAGGDQWSVLLRCPECEVHRLGVFAQSALDALDEELDRGDAALREAYAAAVRENMTAEVEVFARGLTIGAILPEDF